jgi:uncharacterized membrane protein YkoI
MEPAMRRLTWIPAAIVCALVVAGPGRAQEEKVPLDKVPKAVSETIKKRFPKAEVTSASKEAEDGKTVYEVQLTDAGHKCDVTVTPEGQLVSIERTIAEKDLPKTTAATLKEKWPGAKYEIIEEVIHVKDGKESMDYYEVLMTTADKKKVEACVDASGKVVKTEEKKAGDKD